MSRFKVRAGYAYFVPGRRSVHPAGEVIELESIHEGDQSWKLEPVEEALAPREPAEPPKEPAGSETPPEQGEETPEGEEPAEGSQEPEEPEEPREEPSEELEGDAGQEPDQEQDRRLVGQPAPVAEEGPKPGVMSKMFGGKSGKAGKRK